MLIAAIDKLNETMGKTIGKLEALTKESEAAQKASLSLGLDLGGSFKALGGSLDGLQGSLGDQLQLGILSLQVGLQGNTKGLLSLLNEQQQLGQNFKATAATLAKLEFTLGLSREETVSLAETISEVSKTFSISADKIVKSVDALAQNLPALQTAGLGGLAEATASIAGRVGPAAQDSLRSFMQFFTTASFDTFDKLALLGIAQDREAMSGMTPKQQEKALEKAMKKAFAEVENIAGRGSMLDMTVAQSVFGEQAQHILNIVRNLDERTQIPEDSQSSFTRQLDVIIKSIKAPFEKVFATDLFPALSEVFQIIGHQIVPIAEQVANQFRDFIQTTFGGGGINDIAKRLVHVGVEIINMGIFMFNHASKVFTTLFNNLEGFVNLIKIIFYPLATLFRVLDGLVVNVVAPLLGFLGGDFKIGTMKKGLTFDLIDPDFLDMTKKQTGLLERIADNSDEELQVRKEDPESLLMALNALDNTLRVISEEATSDILTEELVENTRIMAANSFKDPVVIEEALPTGAGASLTDR
mgnify:CR=1 FL=1